METVIIILLISLLAIPALGGLVYLVYFLLSLPMRRNERARFFLDLLATGIQRGQSPEHTVQGLAVAGDRALGKPFHRWAAALPAGANVIQALAECPRFLPAQLQAMLKTGQEVGDLQKVLPACRAHLKDGVAQSWTAHHYLVLLAFVVSPAWTVVLLTLTVFVFPRLRAIMEDMGAPLTAGFSFLCEHAQALVIFQVVLLLCLYSGAFLYVGGPKAVNWVKRLLPALSDWLIFHTPWRRKRMTRDFSAMLGVLLDAGVPEARAVRLAAESTASPRFSARAGAVAQALGAGQKLPEALAVLDDTGQLTWRLANAARAGGRFATTLAGWQEALEAKAFQQEQSAAQVLTTSLVFVNGAFVALLVWSVFGVYVNLLQEAVLW